MKTAIKEIISQVVCGDMEFLYIMDKDSGNVGLTAIPSAYIQKVDFNKEYHVDSLVQLKILGEEGSRALFSKGRTMRNSASTACFKYHHQDIIEKKGSKTVITCLKNEKNHMLEHRLIWYSGFKAVEVQSTFVNESDEEVTLEMISSFSLAGMTPFESGDTPNTLMLHRLRSRWADEGRLESCTIEDLQLEPSITKVSANSIRYGQVGSMPVREYFSFIAIEDMKNSVVWGAQVAYAGSWQIEAYRKDDALSISGGLADREFGHWMKEVKAGEKFTTPKAILSVCEGNIEEISQRLTSLHYRAWERQPQCEMELPIIFNEWCTTWGNVSAETVENAVKAIEHKGIKYFVIDAGWYDSMGTWNYNTSRFPQGIEKTVQLIRDKGMIPGIWFELECVEKNSSAFTLVEHMLRLDGYAVTANDRHFWDMRDPYVIDYLTEKVIDFLEKYKFGYFKIDYNEAIGIGCDGAESPGEGLRQHIEGMQGFMRTLQERLPDVIIENCSSGGHRLEPSMMELSSMASFSDAHESINIPIIAANLHRAILPCQSQIWAVVRKNDSARRLYYSMAATFLGRMCLSGDIYDMSKEQWEVIDKGIEFYKKIAPVIKKGISKRLGPKVKSYRHPQGWQAVLRISEDKLNAFVVVHTFEGQLQDKITFELPQQYSFQIEDVYAECVTDVALEGNHLSIEASGEFQGFAVKLSLAGR